MHKTLFILLFALVWNGQNIAHFSRTHLEQRPFVTSTLVVTSSRTPGMRQELPWSLSSFSTYGWVSSAHSLRLAFLRAAVNLRLWLSISSVRPNMMQPNIGMWCAGKCDLSLLLPRVCQHLGECGAGQIAEGAGQAKRPHRRVFPGSVSHHMPGLQGRWPLCSARYPRYVS